MAAAIAFILLCLSATVLSSAEPASVLLQIKSLLSDPSHSLRSWSIDRSSSLCHNWAGVACSSDASTITSIDLSSMNLSGTLSPAIASLPSLQLLNLSNNMLAGVIPPELPPALQLLDLSNNNFSGVIPYGLSRLPYLRTLNLWSNSLTGAIPPDITGCARLEHLDLGGNYLNGRIPVAISNLTSLTYLTLAANELTGDIPSSIATLSSLEWLYLGYNDLTGSVPAELGRLSRLRHLDLVHNHLSGAFPPSLANLTSLRYLFLFDNRITGAIPTAIANLTDLRSLDLSDNAMLGNVPPGLAAMKQLQVLNLFANNLTGGIPSGIAELPSLQVLALWMNQLSGEVPTALGSNCNLTELDLSSNRLTGPIPAGLCNSGMLHKLILFGNAMNGPIPQGLARCRTLKRVRIQRNRFTGALPGELVGLPFVYYLDLSSNAFSGKLDSLSWNMPSLQVLYLHDNRFSGFIPPSLLTNSRGLFKLDLSRNALTGGIPSEMADLSELNELQLSGNRIGGELRDDQGLLLCKRLVTLDLSDNMFSGCIPAGFANVPTLSTLDLSRNQFSGSIPSALGDMVSLVSINLSFNRLVGEIPTSGAFMNINLSAVQGNLGLCGGSVLGHCDGDAGRHHASMSLTKRISALLLVVGILLAVAGIGDAVWKLRQGGCSPAETVRRAADVVFRRSWNRGMKIQTCGEWSLKLLQSAGLKLGIAEVLEAVKQQQQQGNESAMAEKQQIIFRTVTADQICCQDVAICDILCRSSSNGSRSTGPLPFAVLYVNDKKEAWDGGGASRLEVVYMAMGAGPSNAHVVDVYGMLCRGEKGAVVVCTQPLGDACRLSSMLPLTASLSRRRLDIAIGVAKAVAHLHELSVQHGGVTSDQVIVDSKLLAQLLPPSTPNARLLLTQGDDDEPSNKFEVDIAAFGQLLLEISGGKGGEALGGRTSSSSSLSTEHPEAMQSSRSKWTPRRPSRDGEAAEEDEEEELAAEEEEAEAMVEVGRWLVSRPGEVSMREVVDVLVALRRRRRRWRRRLSREHGLLPTTRVNSPLFSPLV